MTPREAAIKLIRVYVDRGDTLEDLAKSQLGHMSQEFSAGIGGFLAERNIGRNKILVKKVKGKTVNEVFSLTEIFNEIKKGATMIKTGERKPKPKQQELAGMPPKNQTTLTAEAIVEKNGEIKDIREEVKEMKIKLIREMKDEKRATVFLPHVVFELQTGMADTLKIRARKQE